jgi:hypothetical protein
MKNQWNAQRDIPSGTVRNNPFLPKREPATPPSPQLMYQKSQWNTGSIPRGSVSSRALMMEGGEEQLKESRTPSPGRMNQSQNRRTFTPPSRDEFEARIHPPSSPRQAIPPSPVRQGRASMSPRRSFAEGPTEQPVKSRTPSPGRMNQSQNQRTFTSRSRDELEPRMHPTSSPRQAMPSSPVRHERTSMPPRRFFAEGPTEQPMKSPNHLRQSSQVPRRHDMPPASGTSPSGRSVHVPSVPFQTRNPMPMSSKKSGNTTQRGRISSPFLQQQAHPSNSQPSSRYSNWKPSQEIPNRAVKGRVSPFYGGKSAPNDGFSMAAVNNKHETEDNDEKDHWIISSKPGARLSPGDWGEAIQAKSNDSEEWDNPNEDWLKASDSQMTGSDNGGNQTTYDFPPSITEQKFHEAESSASRDRDEDVLKMAARKKLMLESFDDPFGNDDARDRDMLMAAKQKSFATSPKKAAPFLAPSPKDALTHGDTKSRGTRGRRPSKKAFPDDDAFGSSFADMQTTNHFSGGNMGGELKTSHSKEDEFFDSASTHYDESQPLSDSPIVDMAEDETPMKQRKSFFNIFGGNKEKSSKKVKAPWSSRFSPASNQPMELPQDSSSYETNISAGHSSSEVDHTGESPTTNVEASPEQVSDAHENEGVTIISEMTNPTLFTGEKQHDSPMIPELPDKCSEEDSTLEFQPPPSKSRTIGETPLEKYAIVGSDDDLRNETTPKVQQYRHEQPLSPHQAADEQNADIKYDCTDPNLDHVVMEDSSTDSEPAKFDQLETKSEEKPNGHTRSPAVRRRKTEKLRKFEETNSRRKEQVHLPTTKESPPSYPSRRTLKSSRYNRDVQERSITPDPSLKHSSRHAKIKSNLAVNKVAKRHESIELVRTNTDSSAIGKKRSKARDYARQRAGYEVPPSEAEVLHSASDGSDDTKTLASIGSDIRILGAILKRPRKSPVPDVVIRSTEVFPVYDEATSDPMQQAGLKLLSAAIIPMQAQVRRFLAMRQALTRMWALIVIQTYTRKWMAQKRYVNTVKSAVAIQAVIRGRLARDDLDFKHVCAIEIQRVTRGYVATMRVYEDIYRVTMVQSYVRMRQAMDKTTLKLAHVIQVQSVVRGFLTRRRQEYQQVCAVAIQANWRRFYTRLNYQFDLLDIIITQSVWRKKLAIQQVDRKKEERFDKAVISVQSRWRQYDCTMNYMQSLADILVAQSAVRRYLALKRANRIRHKEVIVTQAIVRGFLGRKTLQKHIAARKIQSVWRGFVSYADYMFSIADIVAVQKVARGWLAKRAAKHAREVNSAATTIQSACRVLLGKAQARRMAEVRELATLAKKIADKEAGAATSLQTLVRRVQTRSAYIAFIAARKIQAFWRCRSLHNAYKCYRAAVTIQSSFRAMKARQDIVILRGEVLAATLIQSAWRGFLSYTDYIFTIADVITAQKMARGFLARKNEGIHVIQALAERRTRIDAATTVQKGCRGLVARQRYWYTLGCTMQIQSWMRGRLVILQLRREEKARLQLQSSARRYLARQEYLQRKFIFMLIQTAEQERSKKVAALVIQEQAQKYLNEKRRDEAALVIQRFFLRVRSELDQIVRASKRRKNWRKKQSRKRNDNNGEDDLFEDAWLNAVSGSNLENDSFLAQTISNLGSNASKDGSRNDGHRRSSSRGGDSFKKDSKKASTGAKKMNRLPPAYSHGPSTVLRVNHDEPSEYSQVTASTTTFFRLPPARMTKMDPREMSEDLELEEAYMDAEISNAKGRRIADKM